MQNPGVPQDESERIAELERLEILDTEPEERFDRYARLVKRLFDVPISAVTLIDARRQWFKSRQGLHLEETPRDVSFCAHAILDGETFVVEDTFADERFRDNPLVTGRPNVRFYAGYPLPGPSGHRVGTLCIMDRVPRHFAAQDFEILRDIGNMVAAELASLQLASTDELTRVSNRRGFEVLARQGLAMCARNDQPAAVAMIDVDGFTSINEAFGHEEGDRALIALAELMLETFRESDVVARLGRDEFCVLLTGTTEEEGWMAVERLRVAVEERNRHADSRYRLQFSAGVVAYAPERHHSIMQVLRDADIEMVARQRRSTPRNVA